MSKSFICPSAKRSSALKKAPTPPHCSGRASENSDVLHSDQLMKAVGGMAILSFHIRKLLNLELNHAQQLDILHKAVTSPVLPQYDEIFFFHL